MDKDLEILRDSWLGTSLSLVESIETPKGEYSSSVVLATLKGPALDFIRDTRNNRGYEESLWDSVVSSDYVRELFETKNFLGEPDHPMQWENRADIHYPYVSHAIRELKKRPELGYYEVTIDILDTPNGRILKTLIDYGVKLGVSSRGSGRTIVKNGRVIVDPKTYRFITIDVVPMPGNKSARMNNVNESVKLEGLISALSEQIDFLSESDNTDSLRYTKMLLSRLEYPECNNLLEKVDQMLGTEESNTDAGSAEDLVEAYTLISELRSQITSKDLIIKDLTESLSNNSKEQNTLSELEDNYKKAKELVKSSLMKESILRRKNKELSEKILELSDEVDSLNESLDSITHSNEVLISQVANLKSKVRMNESINSEEFKVLQENYSKSENDIQSLTEQLNYITDRSREIYESYFELRCNQLGVNSDIIKKKIGDITYYSLEELNNHITESFKNINTNKNPELVLSEGKSYDVRTKKSLNESSNNDELDDLERIRQNVLAVRGL